MINSCAFNAIKNTLKNIITGKVSYPPENYKFIDTKAGFRITTKDGRNILAKTGV